MNKMIPCMPSVSTPLKCRNTLTPKFLAGLRPRGSPLHPCHVHTACEASHHAQRLPAWGSLAPGDQSAGMFAEGPLGASRSPVPSAALHGAPRGCVRLGPCPEWSPAGGPDRPAGQQVKQHTEIKEPSREYTADCRSGGHCSHQIPEEQQVREGGWVVFESSEHVEFGCFLDPGF